MPGNVESLNAAIAGSLLLYEASRQRAQESARLRMAKQESESAKRGEQSAKRGEQFR
jgi:hypothetical protein